MSLSTVSKRRILQFELRNQYYEGLNQLREMAILYRMLHNINVDDACYKKCVHKMSRIKIHAREMV